MRIAARIVGYLAFAACVVLLRTCLKDQYDADAVKGYLRDAVRVEVRKVECTPVEYSLTTNSVARGEFLQLIQDSRFRTLKKEGKEALGTCLTLHFADGGEKRMAVCQFPCILVDRRIVAVSAKLYFKLLEGRLP